MAGLDITRTTQADAWVGPTIRYTHADAHL